MHSSFLSIGGGFFLAAVCEYTMGVGLLPLLTLLAVLDIVLVGVLLLEAADVGVLGPDSWESEGHGPTLDVVLLVGVLKLEALLGAVVGVVTSSAGGSSWPCPTLWLAVALLESDPKPPLRKSATELHRRLASRENDDGVGVWLRLLVLLERSEVRLLAPRRLSSTLLPLQLWW